MKPVRYYDVDIYYQKSQVQSRDPGPTVQNQDWKIEVLLGVIREIRGGVRYHRVVSKYRRQCGP